MRAAIYARVSTAHHDQRPEVQLEPLRAFCRAKGYVVIEEVVDHGFSGASDKRPGLKRILDLASKGQIEAIVVVKLDRFFRSLKHLVTILDQLQKQKIEFISINDNIDLGSASGRLMFHMVAAFSEFERSLVRERTLAGLEHARRQGKVLGRPKRRPDAQIIHLRGQGLTYSQIQKILKCERSAIYRALKAVGKTLSKTEFQLGVKTGFGDQ